MRRRLDWALYCATEVLNTRRLRGQPIPDELRRYHEELQAEWRVQVDQEQHDRIRNASPWGPRSTVGTGQFPPEPIGTREAAAILGISKRHLRRLVADLDGYLFGSRWLFDRAAVENYSRRKESA